MPCLYIYICQQVVAELGYHHRLGTTVTASNVPYIVSDTNYSLSPLVVVPLCHCWERKLILQFVHKNHVIRPFNRLNRFVS